MPPNKCHFQDDWLEKFPWVQRVPNQTDKVYCKLCVCTFSLSNMGLRAVNSHKNGKKHALKESSANSSIKVGNFISSTSAHSSVVTQTTTSSCAATEPNPSSIVFTETATVTEQSIFHQSLAPEKSTMNKFIIKENCTRAEIMWCIQTVMTHKSLRSAEKDIKVFERMFIDSEIAKTLQLSRKKMAYIIVYGLSPLFKENLLNDVASVQYYVIGFDECLNKITQKQQMDINIRYWDQKSNAVKTSYLTSEFLRRSCANDLLEAFLKAVENLKLKRILQISMDGPNTNLKFFRELQKTIMDTPEDPEILTIGSCGLHALNVAFKTGVKASGWSVLEFFRALYYVFKDSPARRAVYISSTGSSVFPLKFCSVRWLENSTVASRVLEVLPHLSTFIKELESQKMTPTSKTYCVVKDSITDKMLPAKVSFFRIISGEFEGFLREYQSDVPLIPFLYSDLTALIKGLMERFVKKEVLKENSDILAVDVNKPENLLPAKNVDIGISTKSAIKKANASQDELRAFHIECRNVLIKCVLKLQERSPLQYSLTKAVSCFDPSIFINEGVFCKRLNNLLLILNEKKWITSIEAENAKKQLKEVSRREYVIKLCKDYKRYSTSKQRLDSFWMEILDSEVYFKESKKVMKMVMILSHGNSNVERGFSVNADCLCENMKEESVVARRRVYDHVTSKGGLGEFEITRQMVQYARNARAKFSEALEAQSKENKEQEEKKRCKRDAEFQLKALESKRAKIVKEAEKQSLAIEEEIKDLRAFFKKTMF